LVVTDYPFTLDPFQQQACRSLDVGHDVLVAAPTGAGKTVVGEHAVHLAVTGGGKCFYTTPIKALSNQKYTDLVARYGQGRVGLLTGDLSLNSEAPVVVMTTEVLRNMLYAESSTLRGLVSVVLDEVHYLADKERGPVWEEVIISLPRSVRLVCLSATVSNAEEFGEWLATVRGTTDVVVEERRPVPLWQHVMVGRRLYDLFTDPDRHRVNPELVRLARESAGTRPRSGRHLTPRRAEVIERLDRSGLLPAIVFVFSRAGCDAAVEQALHAGVRLTRPDEVAEIDEVVAGVAQVLGPDDRAVLGFESWRASLRRGVAAHHAGLLPVFKQTVETLFSRGLVKVVYATETLALGINMPARSVVLERLVKWNGEQHAAVSAGEYTQLTGRAGRRGIDVEGHGIVTWHPGLDPEALGGLASTRTYPLRSSFRPSYNMAVNLVHRSGRERARRLLESSFAQFQTDRATVGQAARRRRLEEAIEGYATAMACERGDVAEYARLRRELTELERGPSQRRRTDEAKRAITQLRSTLRAHPCHACPKREEHARWAERLWATQREHTRLVAALTRRQTSIATAFDRVCAVLDELGYLDGDTVTPDGQRLRALFGELDLLAAESVRQGLWDGLSASELTACVAALTFQSRGSDAPTSWHAPVGAAAPALERMVSVWTELHDLESRHGVDYLREPDLAFARTAARWASGHSLAAVLADDDLTAGDFVRAMRQVLDMLDQVAGGAGGTVADTARRAVRAVRRGVVAYEDV
jgi:ATP-dependent RNA helicase HelY